MAIIAFDVTGASVSSRIEAGVTTWSLALMLRLPRVGEYLALATGDELRAARMALTIKVESAEYAEWLATQHGSPDRPVIGAMHYFDDPAILSEVTVPQDSHDRMMAFAIAGRFPRTVRLEVPNLTYDWRPDGSGKVWDNRAHPVVGITDFRFDMPLTDAPDEGDQPDVDETQPAQSEPALAKLLRESITLQKWMLGALIVAAAAFAFAR